MAKLALVMLVCIGLSALYVGLVSTDCCPGFLKVCGDGTLPTPCCGYKSCDWICCNCKCRRRGKRDLTSVSLEPTGFERMDRNADGHVDKDEAHAFLLSGACGNYEEKMVDFHDNFKKHDVNEDGKLSYAELNPSE